MAARVGLPRFARQTIAAAGKRLRQLADQQLRRARGLARGAIAQAEKNAGDAAVGAGKQRLLLGGALESDGLRPRPLLRRQRQGLERGVLGHRPDRNLPAGVTLGDENVGGGELVELHRVVSHSGRSLLASRDLMGHDLA